MLEFINIKPPKTNLQILVYPQEKYFIQRALESLEYKTKESSKGYTEGITDILRRELGYTVQKGKIVRKEYNTSIPDVPQIPDLPAELSSTSRLSVIPIRMTEVERDFIAETARTSGFRNARHYITTVLRARIGYTCFGNKIIRKEPSEVSSGDLTIQNSKEFLELTYEKV